MKLVDLKGNIVTPINYDHIGKYDHLSDLIPVGLKKLFEIDGEQYNILQFGFVNSKGQEIVPCIYDEIENFSDGLAAVKSRLKWGFIDKLGNQVISCIYESVQSFCDGLAAVKKNDKWGFINTQGNEMIPFYYESASGFSDGVSIVGIRGLYWLINKNGRRLRSKSYYKISKFHENISTVAKFRDGGTHGPYGNVTYEYKYGIINTNGDEIGNYEYDEVSIFKKGIAKFRKNKNWGLINCYGEEISPCIYADILNWDQDFIIIKNQFDPYNIKYGFINRLGVVIIDCIFREVRLFREGIAACSKNHEWVFMKSDGTQLTPHAYVTVKDFRNGFAWVYGKKDIESINYKWGIIDIEGKEILDCILDCIRVDDFKDGKAGIISRGEEYGFVDKFGTITWTGKYRYDDDDYCSEEVGQDDSKNWKADYFDAMTDGQLGNYHDYEGGIDSIDDWSKG